MQGHTRSEIKASLALKKKKITSQRRSQDSCHSLCEAKSSVPEAGVCVQCAIWTTPLPSLSNLSQPHPICFVSKLIKYSCVYYTGQAHNCNAGLVRANCLSVGGYYIYIGLNCFHCQSIMLEFPLAEGSCVILFFD